MFLRTFFWSLAITVATLIAAAWFGGPTALVLVAVLIVLEVSLSFDNAVINASVLQRMSRFWQKIFLTVGIAIAVFGMRLVFPVLLVTFTAGLGPIEAFQLAIDSPDDYQHALEEAHPAIAAFGGIFLLMIFLDFMFEDREIKWIKPIEAVLAKLGRLDHLSVVVGLGVLLVAGELLAGDNSATVLTSGLYGIVTYLLVKGLGELFESAGENLVENVTHESEDADGSKDAKNPTTAPGVPATNAVAEAVAADAKTKTETKGGQPVTVAVGKAAFFLFLYLEVLDASFSFDGVVGAFAITSNIFIIVAGLGVGAFFVRSITVYLVNKGTLAEYVYLEHGAHWAIGALATILILTINIHINEIFTGLIGLAFILASFASSVVRNRRAGAGSDQSGSELAKV
ncbi:DUF475 domain-containing protein [Polymorphospora sp. NPDC050346]|uniref:DUF475 domain-containing protein n=1 Tax=Polymorphospora sp. NPDC050346 TaxID=3155780 RepID=UPI00341139C4